MNPNTIAAPTFYIPTEDEWYKAAYFSPNGGGVGIPGYFDYATQSDASPGNVIGSAVNQANYYMGTYSTTSSMEFSFAENYLSDLGAFSGSESFYGTFDQSGNVSEFNDFAGLPATTRGLRGGAWGDQVSRLSSLSRFGVPTSNEAANIGFRLASPVAVPEPSTWVMGLAGLACVGWQLFWPRQAR